MDLIFPLRSVFVALPLEDNAKWQFQALQHELQPYADILSLQNPQSPHLTLRFWKELMEIEYRQLLREAENIAKKAQPFTLYANGMDTFGEKGNVNVLFLTVAFSDELARLKKLCPWPNEQPFVPHITLARVRHGGKFHIAQKKIFKALKDVRFDIPVNMLRVYAAVQGRQQTPLEDFMINAENPKH